MGVNLYLKSFEKNKKTVLTHLKSLNFYDANDNEIDNFKYREEIITDFEIIEHLISNNLFKNFYDIGVYVKYSDLAFYTFAYSPISGEGKNEESIIAFESESILRTTKNLIIMCQNWNDCTDIKIDTDRHSDNLKKLEMFIESNNSANTLITITIG